MTQPNLATETLRCKICGRKGEYINGHVLCRGHAALVEIARHNLEGAAKSTLPPPKETPPCEDCGGPTTPILFRPEGPWTWYCTNMCLVCPIHRKVHKRGEICTESTSGRGLIKSKETIQ